MTSCTIIISHYKSENFLRACVRQIRKYVHPEISQHIIICDQSGSEILADIRSEYGDDSDISIVPTLPLYSGYGIDVIMRYLGIKTDYICQVHADIVPIHKNYLYLPIKLIEENNLSFVGQLQCINVNSPIYPPTPFFAMAQCYNVARTETYKEMSLEAGFTRFHNRLKSGLTFKNQDWKVWAEDDYENKGSDDDIVAFSWQDRYNNDNKLGLSISGFIQPSFGRIIDGLVFHFGSCREASSVMELMPELYRYYTQKINEGYSDALIDEMLALAQKNKPNDSEILSRNFWNGATKTSSPTSDELNKRIEELKKEI